MALGWNSIERVGPPSEFSRRKKLVYVYRDCFLGNSSRLCFQPPPPLRNMACRICLTKQANIAKSGGKKSLHVWARCTAKISNLIKRVYMEKYFIHIRRGKHGTFAPRSPRSLPPTPPRRNHHSSKHYFLRNIFSIHTNNVHTLVCEARRALAEEIIITSKRCRIKCLSCRSVCMLECKIIK